jgi:hypothetical protein
MKFGIRILIMSESDDTIPVCLFILSGGVSQLGIPIREATDIMLGW